jgi:hypothetical protein
MSSAFFEGNLTPVDSITRKLDRWIFSISSGLRIFKLRRGLEMDLIFSLTVALLYGISGRENGDVSALQELA